MTENSVKKLTCTERDNIVLNKVTGNLHQDWSVESSLTDMDGEFGDPIVDTTWALDNLRVRDIRHPRPEAPEDKKTDHKPCEHYYWVEVADRNEYKDEDEVENEDIF